MWSKEKFINRKFMIEDLYQKYSEGESSEVDKIRDPFWDPLEDYYIGRYHYQYQMEMILNIILIKGISFRTLCLVKTGNSY